MIGFEGELTYIQPTDIVPLTMFIHSEAVILKDAITVDIDKFTFLLLAVIEFQLKEYVLRRSPIFIR